MVSPDVKCVSVQTSGEVALTWVIPPSGNFFSYHLDTSSNPATIPFTLYTTVTPYSATTATHLGANANTKRMYYRVKTEYTPGNIVSAPKDTFSTIFLTVANVSGDALLNWNKISNQPIATSSLWYRIYREYPSGNWMLRDSTQNFSYTDILDVCSQLTDVINYRIEISDNTGCTSVSNIAGAIGVTDQTSPTLSPIDSVSVDPLTGLATVSWHQSPSTDADSVILYLVTTTNNIIDTVPVLPSFYTYGASTAANGSEAFSIAFKDSCGNLSPIGTLHRTIYLSASFDICAATASLVWNKYINMNSAVTQYQIFRSVNGPPFSLIATPTFSDTNYVDTGLTLGNSYCYFVRAINVNGKTSSSNQTCFFANVTQPPLFTYNRFVTVVSDKSISLNAHVDPTQGVTYYRIRRATGTSGSYSTIANLPTTTSTTITYTDPAVSTQLNSYSYKVESMDSCGNVILASNVGQTMLLKASVAPDAEVSLTWNDYDSWLGTVDSYYVYRAVDGVWDLLPVGSVSYTGSGGSYLDDVAPFLSASKGGFSYLVVAVEGSGNTFGFSDSSVSNVVQIKQFPKIYIPNTFTPNGDHWNDSFIPVVGFIDLSSFNMQIFDRTGTSIFISNNPTVGWNGTKKNHACPEGVYMYIVKCLSANGEEAVLSGTVTLVR